MSECRLRLIKEDGTTITDEKILWKEFFDGPKGVVEYLDSKGTWRNLHPSDEEADKLTSEEVVEMGSFRGMPVFWWGSALGNGARPHTLPQVEEAAKDLGLELLWGEPVLPGDLYLAARNSGAKLLTCQKVSHHGWVQPVETAYPFNWSECVKVREAQR